MVLPGTQQGGGKLSVRWELRLRRGRFPFQRHEPRPYNARERKAAGAGKRPPPEIIKQSRKVGSEIPTLTAGPLEEITAQIHF